MERTVAAALCAVLFATITPCGAQPPVPLERWAGELELTGDQLAAIDEIQYRSRQEEISRRAELERAELEMDREMRKDAPSESAALGLFDAVHEARGKLERIHLRTRLKVRGVLTPVQRQKLEDLMRREEKPHPPRPPKHQ
ncbi:MAG: Spy/CpxP family protein refolding chaperone [Candidatus Eisenbacteria bacterium]|jgi:Spy/CpxP family protein refolding chaperone|nr:Spy/CpxP family protein refolding chaperone [Candidatus Eisenbacteria bacterium]